MLTPNCFRRFAYLAGEPPAPDGGPRFRYVLGRAWQTDAPLLPPLLCEDVGSLESVARLVADHPPGGWLSFGMLNPSKARAAVDDHTQRRCVNLAARLGYGGVLLFNLFAFRATDPRDLEAADFPVGPDNDSSIELCTAHSRTVVAAWGNLSHAAARARAEEVKRHLFRRCHNVICFGLTAGGHPRHPSRLPNSIQPIPLPR